MASKDTTFYVVNFDREGYAVVAAQRDIKNKIYIYSSTGQLNSEDNPLFDVYIDNAISTLNEAPKNTSPNSGFIKKPQDPIPNLPAIDEGYFNGELCIGYIRSSNTVKHPLLKTLWHQKSPYNLYCYNNNGALAPVGCIAVSMGQICTYHRYVGNRYTFSYNWESMLAQSSHSNASDPGLLHIARLLKDIGSNVDMIYGDINNGISSVTTDKNAEKEFNSRGYKSARLIDYSIDKVLRSLNDNNPVYMSGNGTSGNIGHTWVVDGYNNYSTWTDYYSKDTGEYFGSTGGVSYTYLHFNGGNGGGSVAWYLCSGQNSPYESAENFSSFQYNKNNKIITDIKR